MEWYEDPVRARDALRTAAWQGAWRVLGVFAAGLLILAILFPVFAKAKSYSGPGMGPYRAANAISQYVRDHKAWPTSSEQVRPYIRRYSSFRSHDLSFMILSAKPSEAEYVISVNGILQRYRFGRDGQVVQKGEPVPPTVLPMRN